MADQATSAAGRSAIGPHPETPAAGAPASGNAPADPAAAAGADAQAVAAQQAAGEQQVAGDAAGSPGFGARGRMRRRLRFLRKARELAYRDLGGLVFNLHRFGARNDALVLAKLTTLTQIDTELRAIESALGERRPITVLREAGITACPRCAAIHGSEDSFCPNCGLSMGRHVDLPIAGAAGAPPAGPAQASPVVGAPAAPQPPAAATPAPTPASAPVPASPKPPVEDGPTEIIRPPASGS
jgi:hypothetical protein